MSTCREYSVYSRNRRDIRIEERRACDQRNQISVRVARYRCRIAVGDPESRHPLLFRPQDRFDRFSEALPKTYADKQILRVERLDFVLQMPRAADRRFRIIPQ